jgi:predicted dehydrogenase
MARRTTRRQFLREAGLTGIGFWVAGGLTAAQNQPRSPLEKFNVACIGVGGKGSSDTDHAGKLANVLALCDVDDRPLDGKAEKFPKARKYNDYRKMFEELAKDIDAVTVSTPDHSHAPASMMAMRLKKHVYTQKPLTWSVAEARALRRAAKEFGVATQMGNQGSATDGLRSAVELIQAGVIGPVREAHVWTDRCGGYWKQAPDLTARPKETEDIPKYVHWDLFLGPAPERPYSKLYHPFAWRGWRDFGTGALGDMACHTANMAYRALKLGLPTSVSAENSAVNPETYQQWATITYNFPARGELPPVKLVWWEGMKDGKRHLPPPELLKGEKPTNSGSLLIGEKGTLYSPNDYGAAFVLLPRKDFEGYQKPPKTLPRKVEKMDIDEFMKYEWLEAAKAGRPENAYSNFEIASMLTETMLLGNVAILAGEKIEYDGNDMKVPNCPKAEHFLGRRYRQGWTL